MAVPGPDHSGGSGALVLPGYVSETGLARGLASSGGGRGRPCALDRTRALVRRGPGRYSRTARTGYPVRADSLDWGAHSGRRSHRAHRRRAGLSRISAAPASVGGFRGGVIARISLAAVPDFVYRLRRAARRAMAGGHFGGYDLCPG